MPLGKKGKEGGVGKVPELSGITGATQWSGWRHPLLTTPLPPSGTGDTLTLRHNLTFQPRPKILTTPASPSHTRYHTPASRYHTPASPSHTQGTTHLPPSPTHSAPHQHASLRRCVLPSSSFFPCQHTFRLGWRTRANDQS